MLLKVGNDALVQRLNKRRRVGRHEHQLDVGQLDVTAVCCAIVTQHDDLTFLVPHLFVHFLEPFPPDVARHPGILVCFVLHRKAFNIFVATEFIPIAFH